MAACARGAISLRCGSVTLAGPGAEGGLPKRRRRLAWSVALAALAAVLAWANFVYPSLAAKPAQPHETEAPVEQPYGGLASEPSEDEELEAEEFPEESALPGGADGNAETEAQPVSEAHDAAGHGAETEADMPLGAEVGNRLPDFSAELLDGRTFRLEDYQGRPVIINLWATYCGPCVTELPLFERLKAEHPEVEILAVHSALVTEDVAAYLADKGWTLDFAVDTPDEAVFRTVNGSTLLPQTVVLNAQGEVVYNQVGSVTYELLESLL